MVAIVMKTATYAWSIGFGKVFAIHPCQERTEVTLTMEKAPITITATTLGRAQYNPGYYQREYMDNGDIPNHTAAILASFRKDMKPSEKVIVQDGKLYIVEKTGFDKLVDWAAGRRQEEAVKRSIFLKMRIFSFRSVSHSS